MKITKLSTAPIKALPSFEISPRCCFQTLVWSASTPDGQKQFEIAKNSYAPCKAVPNYGGLMMSSAVHVINQPQKRSTPEIHQKRKN